MRRNPKTKGFGKKNADSLVTQLTNANITTDGRSSSIGSEGISIAVVNEGKRKKKVMKENKIWDSGANARPGHEATTSGVFVADILRYNCTICGELGHTKSRCPNECWACGELYHESVDCPNKCWACDEIGHHIRDCPSECEACGDIGHSTANCPDACWTCGEVGHFARDCEDECFVCGRLGHGTQKCKGNATNAER